MWLGISSGLPRAGDANGMGFLMANAIMFEPFILLDGLTSAHGVEPIRSLLFWQDSLVAASINDLHPAMSALYCAL